MALIRRRIAVCAAIGALSVGLAGCGDSGGTSASASNSESQSGSDASTSSGGDTVPTGSDSMSASSTGVSGGMSESLSGTTGAEGGMSESLSGTNGSGFESESASGTGDTTGMVSGGGESTGTSTGEPVDCTTFDNEAECAQAGCLALIGRRFVTNDADLCLDPPSFLACSEPMACAEVETYACKGDPNKNKYQLPNACLPPGFVMCPKPPDQGNDGWADCN